MPIDRKRDPIETAIESALQLGHFIPWDQESAFVAGLEAVERDIAALADSDPVRSVGLYEAFIAGCFLKSDDVRSEWEFRRFIVEVACGWILARQAGDANPGETTQTLLSWMDRDDYGFFHELGSNAVKVLDRSGLAAFEKQVQGRFETACDNRDDNSLGAQTLKTIYGQQCNVEKYLSIAERAGLTASDCAAAASMFDAQCKLDDALACMATKSSIPEGDRRCCSISPRPLWHGRTGLGTVGDGLLQLGRKIRSAIGTKHARESAGA